MSGSLYTLNRSEFFGAASLSGFGSGALELGLPGPVTGAVPRYTFTMRFELRNTAAHAEEPHKVIARGARVGLGVEWEWFDSSRTETLLRDSLGALCFEDLAAQVSRSGAMYLVELR